LNSLELLHDLVQSFEVMVDQFTRPPEDELEITDLPVENARWELLPIGEVLFTANVMGDLTSYEEVVAVALIWAPDGYTLWGTSSASVYYDDGASEHEVYVYVRVDKLNFDPEMAVFELQVWGVNGIDQ
jgi:hypothetical protein